METEDLAKQLMLVFAGMRKSHAKYHITGDAKRSEIAIISVLHTHNDEGGVMITEISKKLSLPPSAITPVINALEEKGFIVRKHSPADRRIVLVQLTKDGLAFFEKKMELYYHKAIRMCKHLGEEDTRAFIRIVTKVTAFMNSDADEDDCNMNRTDNPDNDL